MSTATRIMLSRTLKRSLPCRPLLLPQQRGLASHADKTTRTGDEPPAHESLKKTSFKPHHPISTAIAWGEEFWRNVPAYRDVSKEQFLSYRWSLSNSSYEKQIKNSIDSLDRLHAFMNSVLPEEIPGGAGSQSKEQLIEDIYYGAKAAPMSIRITRINWEDPRNDPIFRQFIPMKSLLLPDHPKLELDSLHEKGDEPVEGLVHRYPDKALFLAVSVCPTYCAYCTRARAVGGNTECVTKQSYKPGRTRWDEIFTYIEANPQLQDIVVSGGDSFYIHPEHIRMIGDRLINIPHIRRFRFASKGLAVAPIRFLDTADDWTDALIEVSQKARDAGKSMALHTHFNHPNEFSWITEVAAQRLNAANVTVRNQTVLLKGINDDYQTMSTLIRKLADNNVTPYYVYICDMVKNSEHFRTPLQTLLDLEVQIRGTIAGFNVPQFIVDLPGGGGKRIGSTYESYDRETGVSKFKSPAITTASGAYSWRRKKPEVFEYHDPIGHNALVDLNN